MENKLSNEVYRSILELVINKSEMRQWMLNPVNAFGKTHATDGYSIVSVPEIGKFENVEEKFKNVYPIVPNIRKVYSFSELKSALDKMPRIDLYDEVKTKCDACNGEGEVDFEFSHKGTDYTTEGTCPVCDGDGVIMAESDIPNGKTDYNYDYCVKIGISGIHIKRILLLISIAELVGSDSIELLNQTEPQKPSLFKIGDIEIITMPCVVTENESNCPVKI